MESGGRCGRSKPSPTAHEKGIPMSGTCTKHDTEGCLACKEEIARLHKLVAEARCYIDPEKHVEWEAAAFAETEPCDRLFDENERLRALVAQQREECDEARARAIRWNNEHAAAEDRWVEERDALRAEVLQLRKNLLRTWAAAEVREYDLRKLVAQQREALSTALNRAEQLFASDRPPPRSCGHCGTPSASCDGDCADAAYISQDLWKARAVLAAEVPGA